MTHKEHRELMVRRVRAMSEILTGPEITEKLGVSPHHLLYAQANKVGLTRMASDEELKRIARMMMYMRHGLGMTVRDISACLGISKSEVAQFTARNKNRVNKATLNKLLMSYELLREFIADWMKEELEKTTSES